jgi:cytoskeletal protein CcmA (bactofilin family)
MRWNRRKPNTSDAPATVINEGSEITGNCSFNGSVMFSGIARGDLQATATLTIGRSGRVEASLRAPIVIVEGEVKGSIVATERIEIRERARVVGDLQTAVLVIEEGAVLDGQTRPLTDHGAVTTESRRAGAQGAAAMTTTFATART